MNCFWLLIVLCQKEILLMIHPCFVIEPRKLPLFCPICLVITLISLSMNLSLVSYLCFPLILNPLLFMISVVSLLKPYMSNLSSSTLKKYSSMLQYLFNLLYIFRETNSHFLQKLDEEGNQQSMIFWTSMGMKEKEEFTYKQITDKEVSGPRCRICEQDE